MIKVILVGTKKLATKIGSGSTKTVIDYYMYFRLCSSFCYRLCSLYILL